MKSLLHYLIISILIVATYGSIELSIDNFYEKNICPKLLGIPACYLVSTLFSIGLIAQLAEKVDKMNILFFVSISLVFLMASNGTLTELSGKEVCPRTAGGTPMCFISFGICSSLLLLKFLMLRFESKITKNEFN